MLENLGELNSKISVIAPKIYMGLIIFFIFWIASIIANKLILVFGQKARMHKNIISLLGRIAKICLIILGAVSALGTMGINISALVASLGLTGFALGFALKDALSNVLAGVLVLIYRPFEPGNKISIAGFEGEVLEIDLRYTTLASDDKKILIPNSSLFNNPVVILNKKTR